MRILNADIWEKCDYNFWLRYIIIYVLVSQNFSSQKSDIIWKLYITKVRFYKFLLIIYNGFTSWMNLLTSWNLWFKACVISLWFHDHNHFQFGKWTMQFFIMTSLALNLKVIRLLQVYSFNILPKWGEGGIKKKVQWWTQLL